VPLASRTGSPLGVCATRNPVAGTFIGYPPPVATGMIVAFVAFALVVVLLVVGSIFIAARLGKAVSESAMQPVHFAQMPLPVAPATPHQIKKVICRECGGQKVQPPKSACMYCDYCGALVDWDFQLTVARGLHVQPFRVLAELTVPELPLREHALRTGNRDALRDSLVRTLARHMEICPEAHPPRIVDPAYRQALLHWVAVSDVDAQWDPEFRARNQVVERLQAGLRYYPRLGQAPGVDMTTFAPLVAARKHSMARQIELAEDSLALHPDKPSREVYAAITASMFIQSWLHRLEPHEQEWLIRELGQSNEYIPVPPSQTVLRHCGTCGGDLAVLPGASRVLCMGCGRYNDVRRPEIPCSACGAPVTVPSDSRHFACPFCRAAMHAA
jgi:hypothetical protein